MKEPRDVEALLAKARQPSEEALRLHPLYRGKLEVTPKCAIRGLDDFALWYTPGVAAPCRDIAQHPDRVFAHTNKGNFVAIVSDGTRVLGLGDIGPHAALPVMEGKAILFKYLGGVDAFPLCLGHGSGHPGRAPQCPEGGREGERRGDHRPGRSRSC